MDENKNKTEVKSSVDAMAEVNAIKERLYVLVAKLRAIPKDKLSAKDMEMYAITLSQLQQLPMRLMVLGMGIESLASIAKKDTQ